jgi:anti-anti-sigma regulatory factor
MALQTKPVVVTHTAEGCKVAINRSAHSKPVSFEPELDRVVAEKPSHVELDLAGTDYVSTVELGALIAFRSRILAYGGTVKVTAIQPQVLGIFQCTHLAKIFGIGPGTSIGGAG